jgi:hypothetical protein
VRFGSKALNHWQKSYGPTKLELLGVVTSITDCYSYLRSHHFVVECDLSAIISMIPVCSATYGKYGSDSSGAWNAVGCVRFHASW